MPPPVAAECERGPDDERKTCRFFFATSAGFVQIVRDAGDWNVESDLKHQFLEGETVFRLYGSRSGFSRRSFRCRIFRGPPDLCKGPWRCSKRFWPPRGGKEDEFCLQHWGAHAPRVLSKPPRLRRFPKREARFGCARGRGALPHFQRGRPSSSSPPVRG